MSRWSRRRRDKKAERRLHNSDDYKCIYWIGDMAGTNLMAVCLICNPRGLGPDA